MLLLDAKLRVSYANPAAENLLELSRARIAGTPITALFTDAGGLAQAIEHAIASGASYTEQEIELASAASRACI